MVIQLTLTLKMNTAQVFETSVTVNNNSPIQDYVHPDDHTQPTYEVTPGFKPFKELIWHATTSSIVWLTPRDGSSYTPSIENIRPLHRNILS